MDMVEVRLDNGETLAAVTGRGGWVTIWHSGYDKGLNSAGSWARAVGRTADIALDRTASRWGNRDAVEKLRSEWHRVHERQMLDS